MNITRLDIADLLIAFDDNDSEWQGEMIDLCYTITDDEATQDERNLAWEELFRMIHPGGDIPDLPLPSEDEVQARWNAIDEELGR